MSFITKILISIGIIAIFGIFGIIIYNQHQVSVRQDAIQKQVVTQQQLADNITRAMSEWTTKGDLQKLADKYDIDEQVIRDNLDKLNANISAINVNITNSTAQQKTNIDSTNTIPDQHPTIPTVNCDGQQIPCTGADPFGYLKNKQILALNEEFTNLKVPFGNVTFDASSKDPWSINIPSREYQSVTVLGIDDNQRTYAYNKFSVKVNGSLYQLPIAKSEIEQVYPSAKFSFWNPRLYLGADTGLNIGAIRGALGPSLAIQFMSYGKYKKQPDFSILQAAIGFDAIDKRPLVLLTPVLYNIGQHIPLMNNLYFGPTLGYSTSGDVYILGTFRVGL